MSTALFKFRLDAAGDAPKSTRVFANLKSFCEKYLEHCYPLELREVMRESARSLVVVVPPTPMVARMTPQPTRKIVGNLIEQKPLLQLLE